jgi:hypothetical protein
VFQAVLFFETELADYFCPAPNGVGGKASFQQLARFSFLNDAFNKSCQGHYKLLSLLLPRGTISFLKLRKVTIVSLLTRVVQAPVESAILR